MRDQLYQVNDRNAFPQCVELTLSEGQGSSDSALTLLAEVRCGKARIPHTRYTAYISITSAEISLEVRGGKITPGSRFAEYYRDANEIAVTTTKFSDVAETGVSAGVELSGKITPGPASGEGKGSLKADRSRKIKREKVQKRTTTDLTRRVTALGGNTWTIQELQDQQPLEGLYLGREQLCRIESETQKISVRAKIAVPKKAFRVDEVTNNETGSRMKIGPTKQKLISIMQAKSLSLDGDALIISESTIALKKRDE